MMLLATSAFFSSAETAFSSLSRSRLKILADDGNKKAQLVLKMSENYDNLLSSILVGNNVVNIAMASITTLWLTSIMKSGGATLSTVVTTISVLIFGEITPKSLSKEAPERVAMATAPLLRLFIIVLSPINWLFSKWKQLISHLIKIDEDRRVGGEELLAIVTEAEREGGIDDIESLLIKSAIEFGDQRAMDIAIPRVDVTAIPDDLARDSVNEIFEHTGYSRLPVYRNSVDNIIGILHQKDFLMFEEWQLGVKPPVFVTEMIDIGSLLKQLQRQKSHMAVVVDEFGGTAGIVTMEDILEELVGEIWDEHDEMSTEFIWNEQGDVTISGDADLDDMFEKLSIKPTHEYEASSVSGWVMEMLERIPQEGDVIEYEGYRFTVTGINGRRVTEVNAIKKEFE